MDLFKSITKTSVYKILINNFTIKKLSEPVQLELGIPITELFKVLNYNYEKSLNNWLDNLILFILSLNVIRNLLYIFWDEDDPLKRLYFGDLIQFATDKVSFIAATFFGISLYGTIMYCLFNYLPTEQFNWIRVFKSIEGTTSFVSNKIYIQKSAKQLIKFSLIVLILCIGMVLINTLTCSFASAFFSFKTLSIQHFVLYALPWVIMNTIWSYYCAGYYFGTSLLITIICLYYKLRLYQLDVYLNHKILKRKFNIKNINKQTESLLIRYDQVINEINHFNKFVSKMLINFFMFIVSTNVFIIYNVIYVKLNLVTLIGHYVLSFTLTFFILWIILNALKIPDQIQRNKQNLTKLIQINLQTTVKVKVTLIL